MSGTHYCSDLCMRTQAQCDLCRAQYRKILSDDDIANNRPTLRYNPFANLLKGTNAKPEEK